MTAWLEKSPRPERLVLAWEAPISIKDRARWAVGSIHFHENKDLLFHYFDEAEIRRWNNGRTTMDLHAAGFRGYPAFKYIAGKEFRGTEVSETFERRLPSKKRPDFLEFIKSFRISDQANIDLPTLLSITGGRQINDGFSFVDPLDYLPSEFDLILEVAGSRHYRDALYSCKVGSEVKLLSETENPKDRYALRVACHDRTIGYINRLQSKALTIGLNKSKYYAEITRINGSAERPRIYLILQVRRREEKAA